MVDIRDARVEDAVDIARIHIDMWRIAYGEILDQEFLRQLKYSRSRLQWQAMIERRSGVLLAAESHQDGIVGFAAGGAERSREFDVDGELMALYVLASHHRLGIGRRLVHEMARRFVETGRTGMAVWVLADNPARQFYAHLGGRRVKRQNLRLGERSYAEVAYVWKDLDRLIRETTDARHGR